MLNFDTLIFHRQRRAHCRKRPQRGTTHAHWKHVSALAWFGHTQNRHTCGSDDRRRRAYDYMIDDA